jgi:ribosomal protein L11 methyltransferase
MTFCQLGKDKQPQLLCDFLMEIGACSTFIVDADRGTALEQAIYREPSEENWLLENAAVVCGGAAVGLNVWNRCNVTAHFPASADLQLVADIVSEALELSLEYNVQPVPDRDWVVHVQQSWKPIVISGLVLKFPWHTKEDVQGVVGNSRVKAELQLEGGIAFGTGEHPTTQLCLLWIQTLLEQDATIENFLDYGAGSGVLGLAACALSDRVKSVGVDIDLDAVRIANANAAANCGLSMKSYLPPLEEIKDSESKSLLMKALAISNSEILPKDGMLYDACVANILAAPLVTLAPTLASMVKPNGYLGLSGILEPQAEMIIEAYSEFFDNVKVENVKDVWILVTGRRKSEI